MVASNLLIVISQNERHFVLLYLSPPTNVRTSIPPMPLRLPALPGPPHTQLMRVAMPRFCPSFLGRDPITCPAALSPSSKLNSSLSVISLPSCTTCTLSLFHTRLPTASCPLQACSSCLFAFGHPFNTAENGCYTSGH